MSVEDELHRFSHSLAAELDLVFSDLQDEAALITSRLGGENSDNFRWGPFQPRQLALIETAAERILNRHTLVAGAGAIFDPDRIASPEQLIPWRVRGKVHGTTEPYGFNFDEHSSDYYNFMELPWFTVPKATGEPKLTPPYVDFLGVDEYILTASVPFTDSFGFVGVAGADIEVKTLESVMMRAAKEVSAPFVLLGAENRIVSSTTARFLPGELLNDDTNTGHSIQLPTDVPTLSLYWE